MTASSVPSGIVLTPHALTRHAKRLRTLLARHSVTLTTTQSQEAFAQVLGMKNWHEAQTLCAKVHGGPSEDLTTRPFASSTSNVVRYPKEPSVFNSLDWPVFLAWAVKQGAFDITLQTNEQVLTENHDGMRRVTTRALSGEEMRDALKLFYGHEEAVLRLLERHDLDFAYEFTLGPGSRYRFRVNAVEIVVQNRSEIQITLHPIRSAPPSLHELAMPPALIHALREPRQGLIVFSGSTGAGKTTSLAALTRDHLENASQKIVTFDCPIEYTYEGVNSPTASLTQTKIGPLSPSFSEAMRNVLRHKPLIISVGECRDQETLKAIVLATMEGHRVTTTLHAPSMKNALLRMVRNCPENERAAHAVDLLCSLKVLVNQRLVRNRDNPHEVQVEWEWLVMDEKIRDSLLGLSWEELPNGVERYIQTMGTRVSVPL